MKKICIDARHIRKGMSGLCRYALHIVKGIAALDKENKYYILRDKRFQKRIVDNDNFEDIYDNILDTGSVQNAFFGAFTVNPLQVDVFHSLNQIVPFGLKAKKIITTVHDLMWLEVPHLAYDKPLMAKGANLMARTSFRYSYKTAHDIICISNATASVLKKHYPQYASKCTVITHHDLVFNDNELRETKKQFESASISQHLPNDFMLAVGNTKPYKNIDNLIKAFALIKEELPTLHLVLVGRMDRLTTLQMLAKEFSVSDRILFLGKVSDSDLKLLYKKALFYIFPSLYEGFGIPPLEAMSIGCPVMGSNVNVVKEATGGKALYVDPKSISDIGFGIQKLFRDESLRKQIAKDALIYTHSLNGYNSAKKTWQLYF